MINFRKMVFGAALTLCAMNSYATVYETELSAAHGYVETLDGKPGASGISIPGERNPNESKQLDGVDRCQRLRSLLLSSSHWNGDERYQDERKARHYS